MVLFASNLSKTTLSKRAFIALLQFHGTNVLTESPERCCATIDLIGLRCVTLTLPGLHSTTTLLHPLQRVYSYVIPAHDCTEYGTFHAMLQKERRFNLVHSEFQWFCYQKSCYSCSINEGLKAVAPGISEKDVNNMYVLSNKRMYTLNSRVSEKIGNLWSQRSRHDRKIGRLSKEGREKVVLVKDIFTIWAQVT